MMNDDASFRAMHPSSLFCVVKKKVSPLAHDFTKSTFLIGSSFKKKQQSRQKKRKKEHAHQKKLLTKFSIHQREREREREDEDEEEDKR